MTTPTDKIKEHLSEWQRIDEAVTMPNWTKDTNEEARRFYYDNSAVHRQVIEKLVKVLEEINIHYNHLNHDHNWAYCIVETARKALAECAEMLGKDV